MSENDFELSYEDFLNSYACELGRDAVFEMVRDAFGAGWRAGGGDPDQAPEIKKSPWREWIREQERRNAKLKKK